MTLDQWRNEMVRKDAEYTKTYEAKSVGLFFVYPASPSEKEAKLNHYRANALTEISLDEMVSFQQQFRLACYEGNVTIVEELLEECSTYHEQNLMGQNLSEEVLKRALEECKTNAKKDLLLDPQALIAALDSENEKMKDILVELSVSLEHSYDAIINRSFFKAYEFAAFNQNFKAIQWLGAIIEKDSFLKVSQKNYTNYGYLLNGKTNEELERINALIEDANKTETIALRNRRITEIIKDSSVILDSISSLETLTYFAGIFTPKDMALAISYVYWDAASTCDLTILNFLESYLNLDEMNDVLKTSPSLCQETIARAMHCALQGNFFNLNYLYDKFPAIQNFIKDHDYTHLQLDNYSWSEDNIRRWLDEKRELLASDINSLRLG